MLIEICEDVVQAAEQNKASALNVLEQVIFAHKSGKHLLFTTYSLLIRIVKIPGLPKYVRQLFSNLKRQVSTIGNIYNLVKIKTKLTYLENTRREIGIIYINPDEILSFDYSAEAHLLTENLIDGEFYRYCINFYKKKKHIRCNHKYFALQGGGNTMESVYRKEASDKRFFCIAISDSDKLFPEDKLGQTATAIKAADKKLRPFNCSCYIMSRLREVENFIPLELILINSNYKNTALVVKNYNIDYSFFDMKKGIRQSKLYGDDVFLYWQSMFIEASKSYIPLFNEIKVSKADLNKSEYQDYWGNESIIDGLGEKLLECCLKKYADRLTSIKDSDLTPNQMGEWLEVGELIFGWSCASSNQYV